MLYNADNNEIADNVELLGFIDVKHAVYSYVNGKVAQIADIIRTEI